MEPDQIQSTSDSLTQNQSKATLPLAPLSFSGTEEVLGGTTNQSSVANQTPFAVDVPDAVPSTSLNQGITREDVFQARDEMEAAEASPTVDPVTEIETNLEQEPSFGFNANDFVMNALFGESEPSEAEIKQQEILDNYLQRTIDIQSDLNKTEDQIRRETGLITREKELAETNLRIAQKTRSLRERLRAFDTSAKERGVARNFVQGERRKIEADATAELADEYIIQAAQLGNLQEARGLIKEAVDGRIRSFEIQNQQDQARLNALLPTLEGEEKERAQQLSFALQERAANIEKQRIEQEGIREMMITAAQNGASSAIQQQILASGNVDDAMALAGPYIGRYDRMKVESSLATNALNRRAKLVELALSGDPSAFDQLGSFGAQLKAQMEQLQTQEEQDSYLQNLADSTALQSRINRYRTQTLDNTKGFDAAVGTTAFGRSAILEGLGGQLAGASKQALSSMFGIPTGRTGTQSDIMGTIGAKADFLATAKEMINIAGFDTLVDYKSQGATFGALSEKEFQAIKEASGPLASLAIIDTETGSVKGFRGTDQTVKEAFELAIGKLETRQAELDSEFVDPAERNEIINR